MPIWEVTVQNDENQQRLTVGDMFKVLFGLCWLLARFVDLGWDHEAGLRSRIE